MSDNPHTEVRWSAKGNGKMEWSGLSGPESNALEAALLGANWVRIKDGRLQASHAFDEPPETEPDTECGPFWCPKPVGKARARKIVRRFEWGKEVGFSDPHFQIAHIGAGSRDKDAYERNAEKLEAFGFECLRSRRGDEGRFWEIWYLPMLSLATGALADIVAEATKGMKYGEKGYGEARVNAAVSFLCRNVSFGTLDVGMQRAALTYD